MADQKQPESKTQEVLVAIAEAGAVVSPLFSVGLSLALKLKGLFAAAGDDIQLNIQEHSDSALGDYSATLEEANAFLREKGLKEVTGV